MKKIAYLLLALFAISCTKDGSEGSDYVMVNFNVSAMPMEMDASVKSASEMPLDPQVENPIVDIWILQYNRVGEMACKPFFERLGGGMLSIDNLNVPLKTGESTVIVLANLGSYTGYDPDDYSWPGTLAGLRSLVIAGNYNIDRDSTDPSMSHVPDHLFMVGEESLNVTQSTTQIAVMLSRLCCKLRLAITQESDQFENLEVKILNAVHGFTVFPTDDEFTASDMSDYSIDEIGDVPVSPDRVYRYYYLYENLDSDPDLQTKIEVKVTGKVDRLKRTRVFPITSYGKINRNTFYNVDLTISGSGY